MEASKILVKFLIISLLLTSVAYALKCWECDGTEAECAKEHKICEDGHYCVYRKAINKKDDQQSAKTFYGCEKHTTLIYGPNDDEKEYSYKPGEPCDSDTIGNLTYHLKMCKNADECNSKCEEPNNPNPTEKPNSNASSSLAIGPITLIAFFLFLVKMS